MDHAVRTEQEKKVDRIDGLVLLSTIEPFQIEEMPNSTSFQGPLNSSNAFIDMGAVGSGQCSCAIVHTARLNFVVPPVYRQ
ncbi:MAG: hypothetical protein IPP83_04555 [Flavobacteriales bacterium]|nr:hypothetical protein [Flavobacteriales bacterium]